MSEKGEAKAKEQLGAVKERAESITSELKKRAYLKDLYLFNKEIMGYPDLSDFHKEVCEVVQNPDYKRVLILLPRGHLKTSCVTIAYPLQRMAENRNVRVLLSNATYDMAVTFLKAIKNNVKFNERYRRYFGKLDEGAEQWGENMITLKRRRSEGGEFEVKEPTITAFGMGGNLVSQHYDLIMLDDLVNRDNITTKERMQGVIQTYKDMIDLLEPDGKIVIIGTVWHFGDLYDWILDSDNPIRRDFKVIVKSAIEGEKITRDADGRAKIVEGDVLFKKKFTLEKFENLLNEEGSAHFSAQYMNKLVSDELSPFKTDYFHRFSLSDIDHRTMAKFTLIDPALSIEKGADYTSIVTIGVTGDEKGEMKCYVLDVVRGRFEIPRFVEEIFSVHTKWHPKKIAIETYAFQKALKHFVEEEAKRRGIYLPIMEIKGESWQSKEYRIRGLIPYYESGRILHREDMSNLAILEDELLRFPRGAHDDVIDALAYFPPVSYIPHRRKKRKKQGYAYQSDF